jgi:CRISPR-associated protein Cas1
MRVLLDRTDSSSQLDAIVTPAALAAAWRRVRRKAKNGAAGGDGIDAGQFERHLDRELEQLRIDVLSHLYIPGPLREHRIAKDDGGERLLRIPTLRDRVLQAATAQHLARLLDPTMAPNSFAYRRRLSVEHAVGRVITYRLWGYQAVLDADIERFFDSVPHFRLKSRLAELRTDPDLHQLIAGWLQGFSNHGRGLAQGSPISPLLANLYLDPLDRALNVKGRHMVRFADDFVVMTRSKAGAAKAARRCEAVLAELDLRLNTEKTRTTDFREGFTFIGHRFIGDRVIKLPT